MRTIALLLTLLAGQAFAAGWVFDAPVDVTAAAGPTIIHHVESSGRKSVAVSGSVIAVAWEDNRDGAKRCYIAFAPDGSGAFQRERRLSGDAECIEPAIAPVGDGRFVAAWEEGGAVWARVLAPWDEGAAQRIATDGTQVSLAWQGKEGVAAWSQTQNQGFAAIHCAALRLQGSTHISIFPGFRVDVGEVRGDQFHPSVALNADHSWVVAWEERRAGRTMVLSAFTRDGKAFTESLPLADAGSGPVGPGRGSNQARVALASADPDVVAAVWLEKRDFLAGYDVHADFSRDGGGHFGPDWKVPDRLGDNASQWHATIASDGAGKLVVAWDDDREGQSHVFLAWWALGGFSENLPVPGASGAARASDPAIAMDHHGNLHLAFLVRDDPTGPTRLRYVRGRVLP